MLDAVQAGARRVHPAGKDPLHLALQRDLVDLDEGVGIGGFGRGTRIAGAGLHPQRAELHGLADILVEIDDAAGDLVEPGEARLLVDDLRAPAARTTTSSPGCKVAGDPRHAPWAGAGPAAVPAADWRPAARWRRPDRRLRRRHRDARLGILRNDGGAGRRRQRLRLHRSGRRHALPRRRTVGRRQQPAARQFRHFFVVVGRLLLRLAAAGMAPGGRGGGSEKILPICACAGGASEIVVAATRAAKPVRAMVRNISRL